MLKYKGMNSPKLILTDSYYNVFNLLTEELKNGKNDIRKKRLVFCEEKISLMAEANVCNKLGGTMNTEVYSFGNFLRAKKSIKNALTKEGSIMVIKKVLNSLKLKCFNNSKENLASSMYNLIILLKSSLVSVDKLKEKCGRVSGILKDKLSDIVEIYSAYEEYISLNNLEDQSSVLNFLPDVIEEDREIREVDVFLIGYQSITIQQRKIVQKLIEKAKSVTAILTCGKNKNVYVNESKEVFERIVFEANLKLDTVVCNELDRSENKIAKVIADKLFTPVSKNGERQVCKNVFASVKSGDDFESDSIINDNDRNGEIEKIAGIIRQSIINDKNCRYKDFTVAVSNVKEYGDIIKEVFESYGIPYFYDCRKNPLTNPLITLILSYTDCFIKRFERSAVKDFYKNVYIGGDNKIIDKFINYTYKYNINYSDLSGEFTYPALCQDGFYQSSKGKDFDFGLKEEIKKQKEEDSAIELKQLNEFRKSFSCFFKKFDIENLLKQLNAEEKCKELSLMLYEKGEKVEGAINEQIYQKVQEILAQIDKIDSSYKCNEREFRKIFYSGVSSMELSILPQYNDAVFVGGYKEAGLNVAKNLFVAGLTSEVPSCGEDVSILSDNDIDVLATVELEIGPKMKIINRRERECVAMALVAFSDKLYLSRPAVENDSLAFDSEVLEFFNKVFTVKEFPKTDKFLYVEQARKRFAMECGKIYEGANLNYSLSTLYNAVKKSENKKGYEYDGVNDYYSEKYLIDDLELIKDKIEKGEKKYLESNKEVLLNNIYSATAIENFYNCPYKSFMQNALKVVPREEGEIDGQIIGTLMHSVFAEYVKRYSEDNTKVYNKQSSDALFNEIIKDIEKNPDYDKFKHSYDTDYIYNNALNECKKFCYETYKQISISEFKPEKCNIEVKFGEGKDCKYNAISLLDGKIKLTGKIDRIDTYKNYCRIIDYKTGKVESVERDLFYGKKLQLFLYAKAVDKQLAGTYYFKIKDEFSSEKDSKQLFGKTLNDNELIEAQDTNVKTSHKSEIIGATRTKTGFDARTVSSKENMESLITYSVLVSENAVKNLEEGFIAPSPIDKTCEYCEYKALCGKNSAKERKQERISEKDIVEAVSLTKEGENLCHN